MNVPVEKDGPPNDGFLLWFRHLAQLIVCPLFILRENRKFVQGSACFIQYNSNIIGVTAAHVIAGQDDPDVARGETKWQLGNLTLNIRERVIAFDTRIDVATFRITLEEITSQGKLPVPSDFESPPIQVNYGVACVGFPGRNRMECNLGDKLAACFGMIFGSGPVSSVSDTDIAIQLSRAHWKPTPGLDPAPPPRFDFGGMSGGPVLRVIQKDDRCEICVAGVIYEGPNPEGDIGLEVIRARKASIVQPDGSLDDRFALTRV